MDIAPCEATLGATVTGVDLSAALDEAAVGGQAAVADGAVARYQAAQSGHRETALPVLLQILREGLDLGVDIQGQCTGR